jgi:hypothetical protein
VSSNLPSTLATAKSVMENEELFHIRNPNTVKEERMINKNMRRKSLFY